jgi:biotin synthase-like enzyme
MLCTNSYLFLLSKYFSLKVIFFGNTGENPEQCRYCKVDYLTKPENEREDLDPEQEYA